ncbi:family 43 glycosylhydrolase [Hymenobacter sp. UV11]|uniref:family 43 glycosylhydrolase n=1 Tax=Hymenobacter sp. UV11 TaxID=1849735 RepID=UPI00196AE3AB|nr:family 43 glycosylhydrolase [Hymenobacter sp. UV11]
MCRFFEKQAVIGGGVGRMVPLALLLAFAGPAAHAQTSPPADSLHAPPPALPGPTADPHLAAFGNTFYLYPTTDGIEGWGAKSFTAWSSKDLVTWKNEGVILDLPRDLTWANRNAWAPAMATKNGKYYFYYSAAQSVGVAVGPTPLGPFKDPLGKPLVAKDAYHGQAIDPMVLVDDDGSAYLYWGQGQCHVVKLNPDLTSYDPAAVVEFKPVGYNEGPFVFKRQGKYYLMWSEYDTRDPRYSVAYATARSPLGPWVKASGPPVLHGRGVVQGAGHHSVAQVPGTNQWAIAYHRFRIPGGTGYNRETCLSPMRFDAQGNILPVNVFEKMPATVVPRQGDRAPRR